MRVMFLTGDYRPTARSLSGSRPYCAFQGACGRRQEESEAELGHSIGNILFIFEWRSRTWNFVPKRIRYRFELSHNDF
jgi:hypothetical protein